MASLTLKDIPPELLDELRSRAARDRRSLTQQVIFVLEQAVLNRPDDTYPSLAEAQRQADAWTRLAGSWVSDRPAAEEIREIYDSRTTGRDIDL